MSLSSNLKAAWEEHLLSSRRGGASQREYVYASQRKECVRAMALDLLHPGDQPEWTADQLERFRRGEEREASVVARLMQIGPRSTPPFKVIEGQRRFEIKDRDGRLLIVGKIDGRLQIEGASEKPIFEVKSGQSYARVETFEDLARSPWTRKAGDQLLAYLLAESEPVGLLLIDRAAVPLFLEVRLEDHLERAEGFLRDARTAVDARFGGALPPFTEDHGVCRRCDHMGKSCSPPMDFGAGLRLVTDEDLILAAERRLALKDAAEEYEEADKRLKEALRGVPEAVVGPYVVRGSWSPSTTYAVPREVKMQYAQTKAEGRWLTDFSVAPGFGGES